MAAQYHSIFTEQGLALLREAIQNGTKLGITEMSFGDGDGIVPEPDATFTSLVNEIYKTQLNRLSPSANNPNWLEADAVIPSAVGGFNIREVGLWAGNILVAYSNYPPTYKPSADQGTAQIKTIRIVLQIDNTANFELKIDASVVMATIQAVEDAKSEAKKFAIEISNDQIKCINTIAELANFNGKLGQIVYVDEIQKKYRLKEINEEENYVTVVNLNENFQWVMEVPEKYYASWFAKKDIKLDQLYKLRQGYSFATKNGKAFVIDAKFYIAVTAEDKVGLDILSNSILEFKIGIGSLNLLPTENNIYQILRVYGASNFEILNPEIIGDKFEHLKTTGEWGHGLQIADSKNGYIHRPIIKNCWGDGIDLGRLNNSQYDYEPTNITIFEPYIEGCRRNGISARSSDSCTIIRPTIRKIGDYDGVTGTYPKVGIDIEPNDAVGGGKPYHKNLIIDSATIEDCYAGLYAPNHFGNNVEVRLTGITKFVNCTNTVLGVWNRRTESSGYIDIDNVVVSGTVYTGINYATVENSKFRWIVRNLIVEKGVASFPIRHLYNGFVGNEGEIGNTEINFTIYDGTSVSLILSDTDRPYKISSRFLTTQHSQKGVAIYTTMTTPNTFPIFGKAYKVSGTTVRSLSELSFSRRYSSVIKIKTDTDIAIRSISTLLDFSERTIIYDPSSLVTDFGIQIDNLVLNIGGVSKTKAKTKKIGSKITFRNIENGTTEIIDMSGEWIFE